MRKKLLLGVTGLILVGLGMLGYLAAPFFATPAFSVMNASSQPVQVTAYWRNESKDLGTIAPGERVDFKVNAEAAISFKAKYPGGKEIESDSMYFTSGTSIDASITESEIKLHYEPST